MAPQTHPRGKKPVLLGAAALVVIAVLLALYGWRNTNILGAEAFCDGRLDSKRLQSALDTTGRVSKVAEQAGDGHPEFRCTMERSSLLTGADDLKVTLRTATEEGAFPFTTAVWKDPADRSYFKDGATGAVSGRSGYVVLPHDCWAKIGNVQGSRIVRPGQHTVAAVEATMEQGMADRMGLARLLVDVAQKVARQAGCDTPDLRAPSALSEPAEPHPTDARNVCSLPGFSLPRDAVITGAAEPGRERLNRQPETWTCDLALQGGGDARLSLAATSDAALVRAALDRPGVFKDLPGGKGMISPNQEAVLHCAGGDVYFAARWNTAYDNALRDHTGGDVSKAGDIRRATLQNFLNAAATSYSCPSLSPLPPQG
ncbi:hypothetical protein [Streptomyces sp. CBMA152]|uniref:hypothetical protein n=1 Tax=Streptomyces sp. CBMA152 TaxID=1896312 RepID=UPI001661876D|nr:hypothetical protein [Streptomyces sp. CBMA152]MBD0741692.1 hypothetical protein [Streptomyces sp. CBMA152]